MGGPAPVIAVLGAAGLIGQAVSAELRRQGLAVVPVARRFTAAQRADFAGIAIERQIVPRGARALALQLAEWRVDVVVNCIGVLQDMHPGRIEDVHTGFIARLIEALAAQPKPVLLVQVSIPGRAEQDRTPFSRSKREAERLIAASSIPYIILRPGFVVAPAAYGGSALIRALAALPFDLPKALANRPFAATAVGDIAGTIALVAWQWHFGERAWSAVWDVMDRQPRTVGDVVEAFRLRFGHPPALLRLPARLMRGVTGLGDAAARLGWTPPVRGTALAEMLRGVSGDPAPWIEATGLEPVALDAALTALPATVQEKWFARLYLLKPLIVVTLAAFWILSGLIALVGAFGAAAEVLTSHGFPLRIAQAITVVSSVVDLGVGTAIAFRRSCRGGLMAGIGVSLFYMLGALIATPDLWLEPLGALVKTIPAIVLMVVALATLADR
jgi:uncharacterized protein YbjT (DUF2867 family)